ncbi:AT-hook motif nuclear-localized protein 1-like protein [Tanacetum coccineum]
MHFNQATVRVILITKRGDDLKAKRMLMLKHQNRFLLLYISQQGPRTICILSANGVISSVTLRQPDSSGGTLTYEILSLAGSFILSESEGIRNRSGGIRDGNGSGNFGDHIYHPHPRFSASSPSPSPSPLGNQFTSPSQSSMSAIIFVILTADASHSKSLLKMRKALLISSDELHTFPVTSLDDVSYCLQTSRIVDVWDPSMKCPINMSLSYVTFTGLHKLQRSVQFGTHKWYQSLVALDI